MNASHCVSLLEHHAEQLVLLQMQGHASLLEFKLLQSKCVFFFLILFSETKALKLPQSGGRAPAFWFPEAMWV